VIPEKKAICQLLPARPYFRDIKAQSIHASFAYWPTLLGNVGSS
jgi:hypothetical protein